MLPIYSDVKIQGSLQINRARLGSTITNTELTSDSPLSWSKVDGGLLTYDDYTTDGENLAILPGSMTESVWHNVLHLNAFGASDFNNCGITQIASDWGGRLYYRSGDKVGWWGNDSNNLSDEEKQKIWRELIDSSGGQTINGSLTIDWKELRDKNTGDKISDRCAQLCGMTQLNTTDDKLTHNLDELYTPHVYVNTKSATITNNSGIDSYNYPLNKAGLLTVYNALQYQTEASWHPEWPGVYGAIQTYMPHDLDIVGMRTMQYHANESIQWNPWHFFTPSTKLADVCCALDIDTPTDIIIHSDNTATNCTSSRSKEIFSAGVLLSCQLDVTIPEPDIGQSICIIIHTHAYTLSTDVTLTLTNIQGNYTGWYWCTRSTAVSSDEKNNVGLSTYVQQNNSSFTLKNFTVSGRLSQLFMLWAVRTA